MSGEFTLYKEPNLRNPRLIIGLPDVGYVGLRVIDYLKGKLGAEEFGHIAPHGFSTVPWVSVKNGVIENLELLRNGFHFWKNTVVETTWCCSGASSRRPGRTNTWKPFWKSPSDVGVKRMYIVGSFGAAGITHLEPPSALGVVNQSHLTQLLTGSGVEPYPEYKGIGTIHSSFLWFAKARRLEALGLWAPMPHYIARLPFPWSNYPRASLCLVEQAQSHGGVDR